MEATSAASSNLGQHQTTVQLTQNSNQEAAAVADPPNYNHWDNPEDTTEVTTFQLPCLFYLKWKTVVTNCLSQLVLLILFPTTSVDGLIFQECFDKAHAGALQRLSRSGKGLLIAAWAVYFLLGGLVAWTRSVCVATTFLVVSLPVIAYQLLWHPFCTEVNWYSLGLNLYVLFVTLLLTIDYIRIERMTGGRRWSIVYESAWKLW